MKLRLTHLAIVVLVLGVAAGVYIAFFAYPALQKKRAEMDAIETFLKLEIEDLQMNTGTKDRDCYLEVLGQDPSAEFLSRFNNHRVSVRRFSERKGNNLTIAIQTILWDGDDSIRIRGAASVGEQLLYSTNIRGQLVRKEGKWSVTFRGNEY